MSGSLSVPFTFLGIMNAWSQKGLFFILAIVALGITTWRLWSKEKIKIKKLEQEINELRKPNDPKTLYGHFREYLDRRQNNAQTLIGYGFLNLENLEKWYAKTLGGIELALGTNIGDEDIRASLAVMKSRVDSLKGYNYTRGQLTNAIVQCKDQITLIIDAVKPQLLSEFDPKDFKIYE